MFDHCFKIPCILTCYISVSGRQNTHNRIQRIITLASWCYLQKKLYECVSSSCAYVCACVLYCLCVYAFKGETIHTWEVFLNVWIFAVFSLLQCNNWFCVEIMLTVLWFNEGIKSGSLFKVLDKEMTLWWVLDASTREIKNSVSLCWWDCSLVIIHSCVSFFKNCLEDMSCLF